MQDGVVLGHRHVMRQTRPRQRYFDLVFEFAVRPDDTIFHVRCRQAVVKKQQLTCAFVGPRMGRDFGKCALEISCAQCFKGIRVQCIGHPGAVPHGDQPPRVVFHIGIGRVLERLVFAIGAHGLFKAFPQRMTSRPLFLQGWRLYPAVAVSNLAVCKLNGMHHAIAVIGVVTPFRRVVRVWAIANIKPVQVVGYVPDDRHVIKHIL